MKSLLAASLLSLFSIPTTYAELLGGPCPKADATHRYVETVLRHGLPQPHAGKLRLHYRLLEPYAPHKPTVVILTGGPGGPHHPFFKQFYGFLSESMNVVGFDHRGVGCTHVLSGTHSFYISGVYTMENAAKDLEVIRKDLLGENGKWHAYGISYGGMLAQKYATLFSSSVSSLILDSTFHEAAAMVIARRQFRKLAIETNDDGGTPSLKTLFEQVVTKYPESKSPVLSRLVSLLGSYRGRTQLVRDFLNRVLKAKTPEEAKKLYGDGLERPLIGMRFYLLCEEIYDRPTPPIAEDYFNKIANVQCPIVPKTFHKPMALGDALKQLNFRTFIWGGAYDPVTPIQAMRTMASLIPNALLYENPHAGHSLLREKPECTKKLALGFFGGASDAALLKIAQSAECQAPPKIEAKQKSSSQEKETKETPSDLLFE